MQKKIAIIGKGFVGKAFARLVSSHYAVVTYDPEENDSYPKESIDACDLAVINVPSDSNPDGSCDTSIVEQALDRLDTRLVLIKSTVEPGTVDRLKEKTGKRICFSPEFIGQSNYYQPYWIEIVETPFLIVGGAEPDCNEIIELLEPIMGPTKVYFKCAAIEAELIKYMENTFFATKVTFVNEFYRICETLGVDWNTVREGWLLDTRVNRMHTSVFKNNRGFGGKCFPKDVRAIVTKAKKSGYEPKLLEQVLKSNAQFRAMNHHES